MRKEIRASDLHRKWMKDASYRREYAALEEEFSLAAAVIEVLRPQRKRGLEASDSQ
jgi:hypothetical protein